MAAMSDNEDTASIVSGNNAIDHNATEKRLKNMQKTIKQYEKHDTKRIYFMNVLRKRGFIRTYKWMVHPDGTMEKFYPRMF